MAGLRDTKTDGYWTNPLKEMHRRTQKGPQDMMSLFFTSSLSINLRSNKANNGFTMPLKHYFEKAYWTHERTDGQTDRRFDGQTH